MKEEEKKIEGGRRCKPKCIGTQAVGVLEARLSLAFNQAHSVIQDQQLQFN